MVKDDAIDALLGEYIEDPVERENKIAPIIDSAIEDADGEINGYLNKRYPAPFPSPVPKIVNKLSKDISIYNLFAGIGIDEDDPQKTILTRYKNAIKFLENVAKGLINIGVGKNDSKAQTGFRISSNERILSRNNLEGM
jgi:phage gp36-like protein